MIILCKTIFVVELEKGIVKVDSASVRKLIYFAPVVLAEIPLITVGLNFNSFKYVTALTFFALAVGIYEED